MDIPNYSGDIAIDRFEPFSPSSFYFRKPSKIGKHRLPSRQGEPSLLNLAGYRKWSVCLHKSILTRSTEVTSIDRKVGITAISKYIYYKLSLLSAILKFKRFGPRLQVQGAPRIIPFGVLRHCKLDILFRNQF